MKNIEINLDLPANLRWEELTNYKLETQQLVECFMKQITSQRNWQEFASHIIKHWEATIDDEIKQELLGIAKAVNIEPLKLVIVNLYYDVLKFNQLPAFGCSAFAIDTPNGPLHARNLDWWSEDNCLATSSFTFRFTKQGKELYSIVGWPGYLGGLSGQAANKFSITLNTVSSSESGQWAEPVSVHIRKVLEEAHDYEEAVEMLSSVQLMNDCLFLVTGCNQGEYCVVERTPTLAKVRIARKGQNHIIATNSYLTDISAYNTKANNSNEILNSACDRFNKLDGDLGYVQPKNDLDALVYLDRVMMLITVQQMIFRPHINSVIAKAML